MKNYAGTAVLPDRAHGDSVRNLCAEGAHHEWWGSSQRSIAVSLGGCHTYKMRPTKLAKVSNATVVAEHPEAREIAKAAGYEVGDLCRAIYPNIPKIEFETQYPLDAWSAKPIKDPRFRFSDYDPNRAVSRKAFVRKPFEYDGVLYAGMEFKGVGLNGGAINLAESRSIYQGMFGVESLEDDTGPLGGMYVQEGKREAEVAKILWDLGKKNPLVIAAFELPAYHKGPVNEGKLGIVVRAVQSSLRASQLQGKLGEILNNTFCPAWREPYRRRFFEDIDLLEEAGLRHTSLHEVNIDATGSITDLGDTVSIEESIPQNLESDQIRAERVSGLLLDPDFRKRRDRKALNIIHKLYPHSPEIRHHCKLFNEDERTIALS